jgi:hypothetical protein
VSLSVTEAVKTWGQRLPRGAMAEGHSPKHALS